MEKRIGVGGVPDATAIDYPDKEQQQILLRWIGCQWLIYSAKVPEERYDAAFSGG